MKSHAKASSAGSTPRQGDGPGRIVCEAPVAGVASRSDPGSGAPSHVRMLAIGLAIVALLVLALTPSAFASKGVVGFIGSSSSGTVEGQFNRPGDVAVNQAGVDTTVSGGAAAGDVYVVDRNNNRIQQFSATGTFKRTFGLNVGGAGVSVCTSSCVAGTSSTANAAMSSPEGVAVDQLNGLVYVSDQGNRRIDVFSASGVFQGAFGQKVDATTGAAGFVFCPAADTCQEGLNSGTEAAGAFAFELGQLAVAPSGDVLVADRGNKRVQQFSPTVNGSGEVTAVTFNRAWGGGVVDGGAEGTGTVTNGSSSITAVSTTKKAFAIGQTITGTGIEPGTKITAVGSTSLTLSQPAGASATGAGTVLSVAAGAGNSPQNEIQVVTIESGATGSSGNFKLSFRAPSPQSVTATQTTANIPWNATPAQVQGALEALTNIGGGNVAVTSPNPGGGFVFGGPFTIEFKGRYADTNVSALSRVNGSPNLSGGSVTIETSREGAAAAEICTAVSGDLCGAGAPGSGMGQFGPAGPASIAVDASGASYVVDSSNNRVQKFTSGGGSPAIFAEAQLSGFFSLDLAVDRTSDHVFALRQCNPTACPEGSYPSPFKTFEYRVLEFDSSGALLDTHAAGAGITSAAAVSAAAVAESQSSGRLYVTASENSTTEHPAFHGAFVLSSPLVPPVATISPGSAFSHTATTATFTGTVDPTGFATSCHFEYSPDGSTWVDAGGALGTGSLGGDHQTVEEEETITDVTTTLGAFQAGQFVDGPGFAMPIRVQSFDPVNHVLILVSPVSGVGTVTLTAAPGTTPCAGLSSGGGAQPVSEEATNLTGSQLYHVRLAVTKPFAAGSATSAETTFTTDPGPPLISTTIDWSSITSTAATIDAEVNPANQGTTYHLEYVTREAFEESGFAGASLTPDGINGIGHGNEALRVAPRLEDLHPDTAYAARIAATNPSGTVYGPTVKFTTFPDQDPVGPCLQNEPYRTGPSAFLPDCRVYEQATPVGKNGNDVAGDIDRVAASSSGDGIASITKGGLPGGEGSETYPTFLSSRDSSGWSTQGLLPPPTYGDTIETLAWTPDLAYTVLLSGVTDSGTTERALLLRTNADHSVLQMTPYLPAGANFGFVGASVDDSKLFFELLTKAGKELAPGAAPGKLNLYLYEPATEQIALVGALPAAQGGEAPTGGTSAGSSSSRQTLTEKQHAISASGDEVFFTDIGAREIYLRKGINGSSLETVPVSASQRTPADPNGPKPANFDMATPSGSIAFFTSCEKLTEDSTAVSTAENACTTASQGQDLYAYDSATGLLSDLTVDGGDPLGAQVQGVVGTSDNGEYVYFVANGDLDGAGPATSGDCRSNRSEHVGECSLYLWHSGAVEFVARLNGQIDSLIWTMSAEENDGIQSPPNVGRVSADGKTLVFASSHQQTGYDDHGPAGSQCASRACKQFYRFHVGDPGLACVTCDPTGAPPRWEPVLGNLDLGLSNFPNHPLLSHFVSADGNRVFFESGDKLVPADTNGDHDCPSIQRPVESLARCQDAYEWEAPGTGSCVKGGPAYSSQDEGCLYLLSTGTDGAPAYFADAGASGEDAFVYTGAPLVPQDEDELFDIYDARVGGGLASQFQVLPPSCEGEGCRGGASAAAKVTGAGSAAFEGPGNPRPSGPACKHGFSRRHGRCMKPSHDRKRHHKRRGKRAKTHRGGAK